MPRPLSIAPYVLFALAGSFFMFWFPTIGLKQLLGEFGFIVWNGFLMVGGGFGILGAWQRKAQVEIVSTPLLWAALTVYGFSLVPIIETATNPGAVAGIASIFLGAGFLILGLGWQLWKKVRVAGDLDRRSGGH